MQTFLGVPIMIRGQAWGNLYLSDKTGSTPFTDEDEEAVVILAEWPRRRSRTPACTSTASSRRRA